MPAQAGLPQWRLSDALGATIASRTAGSPVSFGSEDLIRWMRYGECPDEETRFAAVELLQSMLTDEARLLLIDERVYWAQVRMGSDRALAMRWGHRLSSEVDIEPKDS